MTEMNDKMFNKSMAFLKKPKRFIRKKIKEDMGYDTCHRTKDYDASKCHKDCVKLEESKFARNCTANGGLYKCCIIRDKKFCHECRFCCTLSVCTTPDGSYFKDSSIREAQYLLLKG